jgi:ABC-type Fe3+/spermidine/putrescine transport system ATPase subunit
MVRPEAVSVTGEAGSGIRGRIEEVVYLGELVSLKLGIPNGQDLWCRRLAREQWPSTEDVWINWDVEDLRILPISNGEAQEKGEEE